MTTDNSLKLALAKELPGLIIVMHKLLSTPIPIFYWLDGVKDVKQALLDDTLKEVTEREWDWVVNYLILRAPDFFNGMSCRDMTNWYRYTWQQRAEAFLKTVGKWE